MCDQYVRPPGDDTVWYNLRRMNLWGERLREGAADFDKTIELNRTMAAEQKREYGEGLQQQIQEQKEAKRQRRVAQRQEELALIEQEKQRQEQEREAKWIQSQSLRGTRPRPPSEPRDSRSARKKAEAASAADERAQRDSDEAALAQQRISERQRQLEYGQALRREMDLMNSTRKAQRSARIEEERRLLKESDAFMVRPSYEEFLRSHQKVLPPLDPSSAPKLTPAQIREAERAEAMAIEKELAEERAARAAERRERQAAIMADLKRQIEDKRKETMTTTQSNEEYRRLLDGAAERMAETERATITQRRSKEANYAHALRQQMRERLMKEVGCLLYPRKFDQIQPKPELPTGWLPSSSRTPSRPASSTVQSARR